jgi:hypothetical protein
MNREIVRQVNDELRQRKCDPMSARESDRAIQWLGRNPPWREVVAFVLGMRTAR